MMCSWTGSSPKSAFTPDGGADLPDRTDLRVCGAVRERGTREGRPSAHRDATSRRSIRFGRCLTDLRIGDFMTVEIEDTYAEAFRSLPVEFLVTARDRRWLDHAVNAAIGLVHPQSCAIAKQELIVT